jgi:predicted HD phosphohydrolase
MEETEAATFAGRRFVERAVLLRRWDDLAKDPDMATPDLEYFRPHLSKAMYQASLHERP